MFTHVYPSLGKWGNIWLITLWESCHKYGFIPLPLCPVNSPVFRRNKGDSGFKQPLSPLIFVTPAGFITIEGLY